MNSELEKLKLEIEVLKKRVDHLEGIETRRKVFAIIKVVVVIIMIAVILYFVYKFYSQFMDMYGKVTGFTSNPFGSLFS